MVRARTHRNGIMRSCPVPPRDCTGKCLRHERSPPDLIDVVGLVNKTCESFGRRIGLDIKMGVEFDVDCLIVKQSEPGFPPGYRSPWGTTGTVDDTVRIREVEVS